MVCHTLNNYVFRSQALGSIATPAQLVLSACTLGINNVAEVTLLRSFILSNIKVFPHSAELQQKCRDAAATRTTAADGDCEMDAHMGEVMLSQSLVAFPISPYPKYGVLVFKQRLHAKEGRKEGKKEGRKEGTHTHTQIHRRTDTQMHRYTDTRMHRYTDTQMHRYTDAQIHRCTDTLIHWYTDT